jgi:glycosyltransferase involved in cell wall biosynthesis
MRETDMHDEVEERGVDTSESLPSALRVAIVALSGNPFTDGTDPAARQQHRHIASLALSLARKGHSVTVHTIGAGELGLRDQPEVRIETAGADAPADATCTGLLEIAKVHGMELSQAWTAERPDVVHAHAWPSGVAAQVAARDLGVPVVQTFYGIGLATRELAARSAPPERRRRLRLAAAVARGSDRVIALSSTDVEALVRLGVGRDHTRLVPTGIDPDQVPSAVPAPTPSETLRLGAVCHTDHAEGLAELAWAVDRVQGVTLTIGWIGDVPTGASASVPPGVRHVQLPAGVGEGAARFFGSMDVVAALGDRDELVGLVLEAMAVGRPILAAPVGAVGDAVVDRVTGLVARPDDRAQVLRAVRKLARDRCDVEAMGQAAHDRVATRYPWHRIADESLAVLAQAAS